jgi:hypothetical protein
MRATLLGKTKKLPGKAAIKAAMLVSTAFTLLLIN